MQEIDTQQITAFLEASKSSAISPLLIKNNSQAYWEDIPPIKIGYVQESGIIDREKHHIIRLIKLTRTLVEQDFAVDYCKYAPSIWNPGSPARKSILQDEGNNTMMAWTLLPYIHEEYLKRFQNRNEMSLDSMKFCINWLMDSYDPRVDYQQANLLSLKGIPRSFINTRFALSSDSEDVSHAAAQYLASEILKSRF